MRSFHHFIRRTGAVITGLALFMSGILKLTDPVGTGFVVEAYLSFLHIGFLLPVAKVLGVALSLFETLLGAALISGVALSVTGLCTLILIGFFFVLTLLLLIFNPEMDCGCFGQAYHMTHMQSFLKNVVLLALSLTAFVPLRDSYGPRQPKIVAFSIVSAAVLCITVYSLMYLPFVDFTPFAPGKSIYNEETLSGDASSEVILPFYDVSGDYYDALATMGDVMIVSVPEPGKVSDERWEELSRLCADCFGQGVRPIILSADLSSVPPTLAEHSYCSDRKVLLTLNRSNTGCTFVSDAVIVAKFSSRSTPGEEKLSRLCATDPLEFSSSRIAVGRIAIQGFILGSWALLLLL